MRYGQVEGLHRITAMEIAPDGQTAYPAGPRVTAVVSVTRAV